MKNLVVITGSNRGIGLELTKIFAKDHDVIACCRNSSPELQVLGVEILEDMDLKNAKSFQRLSEKIGSRKISVLVNNAGILESDSLETANQEEITEQFYVNALGPFLLTQNLLPHFGPGSKIAFITSRMGSIADNTSGGYYGYRTSKAALNALGKSLAEDLKSKEISVVLLHPGFVKTTMTKNQGHIEADEAAKNLFQQITRLNLKATGSFWHSSGEELPW
ncbi:MAG: SDR family oxidoreductase [Bdellovibrionota bacterium]